MIQLHDRPSEMHPPEKFPSNNSSAQPYLWRDLYRKAVFERERTKILGRIRDAERALTQREHELCMKSKDSAERESVVTALNCLEALRRCLTHSQA